MSAQRKRIQLLPEHLINQIKAGEVIDRPASLLKEILENAIDAESTQLNLHIVDNGLGLIALEDNGKGMDRDDLPLAFARHATSKLEKFEDLYALQSYGFRGEALASVASIARITCSSTPREDLTRGGKILIEGGEEKSLVPFSASSSGTALYIKDLFYNTPARLKFIKSKVAEKNSLKRILQAFILAHPQVAFSLRFDDKEKQMYPSVSSLKERVQALLVSKGKEESLVHFEESYERYKLEGFLIPSEHAQGNNNFLFINKRLFVDKGLHQALTNHLEQLRPGIHFQYALFLDAPADEIDVNVHPGKIEVKFFKSGAVYALLSASLKKNFKREEVSSNPSALHSPLEENRFESRPFSSQSSYIQKEQEAQNSNWKLLANIFPSFQLLQIEEDFFIFDAWAFSTYIFTNEVLTNSPLKEDEVIPLLVSEPYRADKKTDLNKLKDLGFELDKLSEETLVLRTIPEALRLLPYRRFVEELLASGKVESIIDWPITQNYFLQESQLNIMLKDQNKWQNKKILLPLTAEEIKKLFR